MSLECETPQNHVRDDYTTEDESDGPPTPVLPKLYVPLFRQLTIQRLFEVENKKTASRFTGTIYTYG
jgi:hypothetical protein